MNPSPRCIVWILALGIIASLLGASPTCALANTPPTLDQPPDICCQVGSLCTQQLAGSDLDGDVLTFALAAGAPAGASIGASTGVFRWNPTPAQGPGSYPIPVVLTDGAGGVDSKSFVIRVLGPGEF